MLRLQKWTLLLGVSAMLAGCGGAIEAPEEERSRLNTPPDECYWQVTIEDIRKYIFATERGVLMADGKQSVQTFGPNDDPWQVPGAKYTTGWTIPYQYKSGFFAGKTVFFGLSSDGTDIAWWAYDATCSELPSFTPPQAPTHSCVYMEMGQLDPGNPPDTGGSGNPWCPDGCPPPTWSICVPKEVGNYAKASCNHTSGVVTGPYPVCCKPRVCHKGMVGDYDDGCGGTITCDWPINPPPPTCGGKGKPQCI